MKSRCPECGAPLPDRRCPECGARDSIARHVAARLLRAVVVPLCFVVLAFMAAGGALLHLADRLDGIPRLRQRRPARPSDSCGGPLFG
jgi:hypothetical protein